MNKRAPSIRLLLPCLVMLSFLSNQASASFEVDTSFELGSIGVLRSSDNMDGLFTEYVTSAYKDYFAHQTRFIFNDISSVDGTLDRSNLPYNKLIMDRDILVQLAKSSHSQTILRTQVIKEGTEYHFILDWLHAPHLELLGTFEFRVEDLSNGKSLAVESLNTALKQALSKLIGKIPFQGQITGRDGNSVTINLGTHEGIRKGDILSIGTLDEVRLHPLLKRIVEWKSSSTGRIEVEQVEEGISFCKMLEEDPGREVARAQKIFQIQKPTFQQTNIVSESVEKPAPSMPSEMPQIGNLSFSLFPAFYDRQFSNPYGISNSGGGIAYGAAASGEILLTREWFAGLDFKFSFLNFSQNEISTGTQTPASRNGGVSQSAFTYKFYLGYLYLLNGDLFGPKGWLKGGFKSDSFNVPITVDEFTGPISFNSFFIAVGADLPLRNKWGAIANLSFRLTTSITQSWLEDTENSTLDVEFYLGGYYRLNTNSTLKLGIEVVSNGATFETGAGLNQKTVSIVPSLLYYF